MNSPQWERLLPLPGDWRERADRRAATYPQPYQLTCDLAVFPVLASTSRLAQRTGLSQGGIGGVSLAFVTAARYLSASYGEQRKPFPFQPGGQDFYREVAIIVVQRLLPGFAFSFPRLWVDSNDPSPLEIGWRYGFPKGPASILMEQTGNRLSIEASDDQEHVLTARANSMVPVPASLATALTFGEGVFPLTGQKARLRLDRGQRAALLRVEEWEGPALTDWGVKSKPRVGLWLEKAVLSLGLPHS